MLETITFLLGFGAILASFIVLCSLVQSGRITINHLLIARVTIAGFILPPFGVVTFISLAAFPLLLIGLAIPIASLCFRAWLETNPEVRAFTTGINVIMLVLIVVFDVNTLIQGKITPDIQM